MHDTCNHQWTEWKMADQFFDARFCPLCEAVEARPEHKYIATPEDIERTRKWFKTPSPEDVAKKERQDYLESLKQLPIDERIAKLEAWQYDYRPPIDIHNLILR